LALPLLPLIGIIAFVMLVIAIIIIVLGIFWIQANPIPTLAIVIAMAVLAYLWKNPKARKRILK